MRVAFLGYGRLGGPLADHLQRLGHQVTRAAGDAGSDGVTKAVARNPNLEVEPPGVAAGGRRRLSGDAVPGERTGARRRS